MSVEAVTGLIQLARGTVQQWKSQKSHVPAWAMIIVTKRVIEARRKPGID